jgi:serine/threonine-protein phosphatase 2A regulatory subunit B'
LSKYSKILIDVPQSKRQELFVIKLIQCQVLFDFNDPSSDLRNKEIKRQELQEMLEYVATSRGAISDMIYPDVIRMVNFIYIYDDIFENLNFD